MGSLISILVMSSSIQFTALTLVSVMFILLTPFTKVEESFSTQAIHDFLYIGFPKFYSNCHIWLENNIKNGNIPFNDTIYYNILSTLPNSKVNDPFQRWDHEEFPGAVSRSFIGPFIVSALTLPWSLIPQNRLDKFYIQIAARVNLAILVIAGFNSYANSVGKKFGSTTRRALIVLTLTQFHFVYYASRPLPNTFALILTLFATSKWLKREFNYFILLVALTVIIFRFETALFFGWIILYEIFLTKRLSIFNLIKVGIPSGILALMLTIGFDSFMWNKLIWPEGESIYFNIYLNKSREWGTQSFFWYFYSALPRSLLLSLIYIPFCTKKCFMSLFSLSCLYVFFYSLLPHKELRFIMYAIPILNTCAANTVAIIVEKFEGTKPFPESWLGNLILHKLGYPVPSNEEAEAAERLREQKEEEEEEMIRRKKDLKISKPPKQYDAISPYNAIRRRGVGKHSFNGVEEQLDEQYSKITAAVLEKHRPINNSEKKKNPMGDNEDPPSLSYTFIFIFIIMGIHIWCNVGCTVYASLASWNNYPGGDAIIWLNDHMKNNDLKHYKSSKLGVYISNLGAQTGATRFIQLEGIIYDKSPSFSNIANRTHEISRKKMKYAPNNFDHFKISYLILEKIDVPFLQQYCSSISGSKTANSNGIEGVVCNFGDNTRNCKILKVINGFSGIDLGLDSNNVIIKTTPMLWIFRCVK